jgi:hypothetical protein
VWLAAKPQHPVIEPGAAGGEHGVQYVPPAQPGHSGRLDQVAGNYVAQLRRSLQEPYGEPGARQTRVMKIPSSGCEEHALPSHRLQVNIFK